MSEITGSVEGGLRLQISHFKYHNQLHEGQLSGTQCRQLSCCDLRILLVTVRSIHFVRHYWFVSVFGHLKIAEILTLDPCF